MLGLYVHVPFCSAICNYCNFNRGLFDGALKERYVEALIAEISRVGADPRVGPGRTSFDSLALSVSKDELAQDRHGSAPASTAADTIYFGGGTPSLLEPHEIRRIIDACESAFAIAADREVTLEANPESVSEARLAGFREAGVNRVSFGVQSFRNEELRRLSRLHDAARAAAAVGEARAAGFDNVSLDLMMWLPEQGVTEWIESVDQAIALAPEHMSLYLLELYPNAPIKEEMARARWSQAPDEVAAAMYLTAMDRLDEAGYDQYEVSNVAVPGRRSRHNLKYWQDGDWIGIGCGAHSTRDGVRWKNVSATDEYIDRLTRGEPTATDVRRLSADERLGDALFTGLRLMDGIDLAAIYERYGVDVWERYGAELSPFLDEGCLKREGPRLKLTREGMLIAHEVMTIFV
jgi:oxygen-independent coproporphyrinogen-3 oxidase